MVKWIILIIGGVIVVAVLWVAIIEAIMWRLTPLEERDYIKYKWWYKRWMRWMNKRNKGRQAKLRAKEAKQATKDYIEKNRPGWVK